MLCTTSPTYCGVLIQVTEAVAGEAALSAAAEVADVALADGMAAGAAAGECRSLAAAVGAAGAAGAVVGAAAA